MFTAALFIITNVNIWKQPKSPLRDEWINKTWCVYTMAYYAAFKKDNYLMGDVDNRQGTMWVGIRRI